MTTHKRTVGGDVMVSPLNERSCNEGRDSVAKAMYESLFSWLVGELNTRLNTSVMEESETRIVKLLDIYGFEVFDHNSFEQLCVNYTNEKIHQIYL
jgi:myosin heavy subunit